MQILVQETANGLHGMHGVNALQHAMVELKTEQEKFYRKQLMEEKTVMAQKHSLEIAPQKNAPLTANGRHGENGTSAQEHVAVECKEEAAPS